jgi:hypothetical protein
MSEASRTISILIFSIGAAARLMAGARQEYAFLSYPLEKVRPREMPEPVTEAVVRLAGNEHESVLLGVCNPSGKIVTAAGIRISRPKESLLSLSVSRIANIPVTRASRWFAPAEGPWPDPVIPIDAVPGDPPEAGLGETRWLFENAVEIPRGENRIFLLEIYLPGGARAAEDLTVTIDSPDAGILPLGVRVESWDFDLPRESTMASSFIFSRTLMTRKHAELSGAAFDPEELAREYLRLLAGFRISVADPYEESPAAVNPDGTLSFDWRGFDGITGEMLDGTLFPGAPPATSFRTPKAPAGMSPEQSTEFLRETAAHMRSKGWLSRMYYLLPDEPLRSEYPKVRAKALSVKNGDPGIRTLVTEPNAPELEGSVDIWCVDIPYLGDSLPAMLIAARWPYRFFPDFQWNPSPSRYLERRAMGEEAWIYTCNSAVFLDYPNLFIDSGACYDRIIPWLAFRWGFTGLLYWQTVYGYSKSGNPWDDQYQMMDNGEGNLLYPGIPGSPDIAGHRPIPSLRLHLLRDGFEDYEYLAMLSMEAGVEEARKTAKRAARTGLEWVHSAAELQSIRDETARRIQAAMHGTP